MYIVPSVVMVLVVVYGVHRSILTHMCHCIKASFSVRCMTFLNFS